MNVIKIVVALICAYGLFVSVSYLLMRLLFPRIETENEEERTRVVRTRAARRMRRPLKTQKNLAF